MRCNIVWAGRVLPTRIFLTLFFLVASQAGPAAAATVSIPDVGPCTVRIDGPIEAGDLDQLLAVRSRFVIEGPESTAASLACLNSPGGSLYEGLAIAELFYEAGVGTRVGDGDVCYSVCAIMFMMGRAKGDEISFIHRILHVGGNLGFHRPYLTLDDARAYTSGEINEAFDMGVEGIFDLMRLASLPEPWGAGQMMSADLVQVMLATPGEEMHVISTVEEAVRWSIDIEGDKPVLRPRTTNLFFACEHALSAQVRRSSEFYDGGLITEDIFALEPLGGFAVDMALGTEPVFAGSSLTVGNLRSGYVEAGCRVIPNERTVGVCGVDQTTDVQVGGCDEDDLRYFDPLIYHHPLSQLASLGLAGAEEADASRVARCRIFQAGLVTDDEACLQAVELHREVDGGWARHVLTWPTGARTVVDIRAEIYDEPPLIVVNGEAAELGAEPDPKACVQNLATGNVVCVTALQ